MTYDVWYIISSEVVTFWKKVFDNSETSWFVDKIFLPLWRVIFWQTETFAKKFFSSETKDRFKPLNYFVLFFYTACCNNFCIFLQFFIDSFVFLLKQSFSRYDLFIIVFFNCLVIYGTWFAPTSPFFSGLWLLKAVGKE